MATNNGPTIINNRSSLETDPLRNFRFLVTFKPLPGGQGNGGSWLKATKVVVGFTSVSGLSVTTDSIPYREGGYNTTVHQIPGQTTFSPITLQRGVVLGTPQHWDWMRKLFATVQTGTTSLQGENFRCDLEIAVLTHPIAGSGGNNTELTGSNYKDHVSARFQVYNAWPTSVAYSDLNAGDNALFVEQITLTHEGFDMTWGSDLTKAGSAPKFK
jgi:phage tail-like protein